MRDKEVRNFVGINKDVSDRNMPEGYYRDAINMKLWDGEGATIGAMTPYRSFSALNSSIFNLISSAFHLGSFEDIKSGYVYEFFRDLPGITTIIRLRIADTLNAGSVIPEIVFRGDIGGNLKNIRSISIVDNELGWTDGEEDGWKINLKRSARFIAYDDVVTEKLPSWKLIFDKPDGTTPLFTNGQEAFLESFDTNGVKLGATIQILDCDGSFQDDVNEAIRLVYETMITPGNIGSSQLVTVQDDSHIILNGGILHRGNTEYKIGKVVITTTNGLQLKLVEENFLPDTLSEYHCRRIKRQPEKHPTLNFVVDQERSVNTLYGTTPQFQIQYVYKDGEKSAWGPISPLPDLESFDGDEEYVFNAIDVDFSDPKIWEYASEFRGVNIGVRFGNDSNLYIAKYLDLSEIGISKQWYRFYNDEVYTVVDPAESGKLFDSVPNQWLAEESVASKNGEGERVVIAGYHEGYENIPINTKLTLEEEEKAGCPGTYNVRFRVRVKNLGHASSFQDQPIRKIGSDFYFGGVGNASTNNMADFPQYKLPLKGFVGFLAGTNYKTITKQNTPSGVAIADAEFGVYNDGQTSAINTAQSAGDVYSEGIIKSVKPGNYILRIASNLCTQGDGTVYDINGSEYQQTSTYAYGTKEILLNLPDIPSGSTSDVYAGEITVEDLTNNSNDIVYHGYVVDSDGDLSRQAIKNAFQMEGQQISVRTSGSANTETVTTDHNGFFYGSLPTGDGVLYFEVAKNSSATGSNIVEEFDNVTATHYIGSLDDLRNSEEFETGTSDYRLVSQLDLPYSLTGAYEKGRILVNQNSNYDAFHVDTPLRVIYDSPPIPLQGISVALEGTGRAARTQSDGWAYIRTYSPNTATSRTGVNIQVGNDTPACLVDNNPYPETITIQYGPSAVNSINQYELEVITIPSNYWKHGDIIQFGLVYFDKWGRASSVQTNNSMVVRIPFPGETPTSHYGQKIKWEISHNFPFTWATHYQWVRTKGVLENYIQVAVDGADYVSGYDPENDEYYYVGFGGNATEVHVDLSTITNTQKTSPSYRLGYEYVPGDRVRLVKKADGTPPTQYCNAKVLGQIGNKVVIDYDASWPKIEQGDVLELYTPIKTTSEDTRIFYEFGEKYDYYFETNGVYGHTGPTQNQTVIQPAIGTFELGNVYERNRKFMVNDGVEQVYVGIEDNYFSDYYPSKSQSIGRPNIINPNAKRVFKKSSVRFSNKYYSGDASGTSSFEALNEKNFPEVIGEINAMVFNQSVLVVIGTEKVIGVYVGESQIASGSNSNIISVSNEVLGAWNMMKGDFGTVDPRTVAVGNGNIYWWDRVHGKVARLAADGLTAISDYGMSNYFHDISMDSLQVPNANNIAVFVPRDNTYVLFLESSEGLPWVFSERSNTWVSKAFIIGEGLAVVGHKRLVGAYGGGMHLLFDDPNAPYLQSQITMVFNKDLLNEKTYTNIAIDSRLYEPNDLAWIASDIKVYTSDNQLQESILMTDDFRRIGGQFTAPFWRDKNSEGGIANGDRLRGKTLEVTIQSQNATGFELYAVEVSYADSQRHL